MQRFRIPTQVHIQPGCVDYLPTAVRALNACRVLFVTDPGLADRPPTESILASMRNADLNVTCFAEVESNPRTTTAERIAAQARDTDRELIVGFGGGSSLDAAKAASMLATNTGSARAFIGRTTFEAPPLPFIAVPTTCGTGSEVTWVSVLTDVDAERKISIKGESLFPTVALVDARLLRSLPKHLLASTAIDALTHALEATTCNVRNPVSDAMAEKAIALLFAHLPDAYADANDASLEAVMRASTLAGLAFGNTDVAAVHCLSETLGGIYDLPHGLCNAVLLAQTLRAHGDSVATRLCELAAIIDPRGEPSAEAFLTRLDALIGTVEIPPFASLGIAHGAFPRLARGAVQNGSNGSNPREMGEAEYLEILEALCPA